jgi:hypothetical protein
VPFFFFALAEVGADAEEWRISFKQLEFGIVLGEGAQGMVVKALWLGTACAVKKFPHGDFDAFVQEARILKYAFFFSFFVFSFSFFFFQRSHHRVLFFNTFV